MTFYPRVWGGAALGLLLGWVGTAAAQNLPFGGRTAAMGGTGIARGDDSAMPVLNPAGLALTSHDTLSLSASLYAFHAVDVPHFNADKEVITDPFGRSIEVSQLGVASNTIETLPTSLAYMYHLAENVFAVSVTIPRSTNRRFVQNLDQAAKDPAGNTGFVYRDNLTYVQTNIQYVAGLSLGRALSDKLRAGATIGINYAPTLIKRQLTRKTVPANATDFKTSVDDYTRDSYSLDLSGIMGAQYDVTDALSVGAVFQTPAAHVHGHWGMHQETFVLDPNGNNADTIVEELGDSIDAPPMRVGGGVQYRQGDSWAIAVDAVFSVAIKNDRRITVDRNTSKIVSGQPPAVDSVKVDEERSRLNRLNGSIGGEFRISETSKIRLGVYTDMSLDPAVGANPDASQVLDFPFNRYGATLGLGTITGPVDSTIGVAASYGQGDTARLDPNRVLLGNGRNQLERTEARVFDFMLFITGTVDLKKASGKKGGE